MLPSTDHNQPMSLCLEVIAWNGEAPHETLSCVIEQRSGSVGRADDNDLVLADHEGVVSRVHARIEFDGGEYFLIDTSTNGTYVRTLDGQNFFLRQEELTLFGSGVVSLGKHIDKSQDNLLYYSSD